VLAVPTERGPVSNRPNAWRESIAEAAALPLGTLHERRRDDRFMPQYRPCLTRSATQSELCGNRGDRPTIELLVHGAPLLPPQDMQLPTSQDRILRIHIHRSHQTRSLSCNRRHSPWRTPLRSLRNPLRSPLQPPPPQPPPQPPPPLASCTPDLSEPTFCLSKTWKVDKLTSEISSSPNNNWWPISVFAVDIASADALLASANKPAAPKTGAALLRRFRR
jgi:hypothetical protein